MEKNYVRKLNELNERNHETYVKGFEKLSTDEIELVRKIAGISNSRWFVISDDCTVYDLESGDETSLEHGICMLIDCIKYEDFVKLSEKEKFALVKLLGRLV